MATSENSQVVDTWRDAPEESLSPHLRRLLHVRPAGDAAIALPGADRARPHRRSSVWNERTETLALIAWDLLISLLVFRLVTRTLHPHLGLSGNAVAVTVPIVTGVLGGYRRVAWLRTHMLKSMALLMVATAVSLWAQTLVSTSAPTTAESLVIFAAVPIVALLGRWVLISLRGRHPERILIIGGGVTATHVLDLATRRANSPISVAGYIDNEPFPGLNTPRLGDLDDLSEVLRTHMIDRVIVAFSRSRDSEILSIIRDCDASAVDVDVVPRFFDYVGPEPRVYAMDGMAFINVRGRRFTAGQRAIKRTFDIVVALLGLVVTFPVFVAAAIAIIVESGRPVFFRQMRVGASGESFEMIKFRTMTSDVGNHVAGTHAALREGEISLEEAVQELKDQSTAAVTRVGAFLRKSSLDELPQLWNVLIGDMSLVGPRPLQNYEVAVLDRWELYRHEMRPGITGLWQVTGRSELNWSERMQLDYTYVRHWSPMLDVRILFDTVPATLRGRGAV